MRLALFTTDNRQVYKEYSNPTPYFGTAPEALLEGFASLRKLEVHVISCARQKMQSPEKLAPNIWFHSVYVPKIGWMRTLYQGCIRATRRKLSDIQPDIVHGQGTELDCAMNAVCSGFPNVVTIHGNMAELARLSKARIGSFGWLAARLENFALPRTAGVFCNSKYTLGLVRGRARKTWEVPNPIRAPFFQPLPPPSHQRSLSLLNIGVVQPRKRQIELLEMCERIHRRGIPFQLGFLGDANPQTSYGSSFLQKLQQDEFRSFARHLGKQHTNELIRTLDNSAALLHFPFEESFGLVVAEALARNLKLFGGRVGGIADIAQGVTDAELFGVEDWNALESALERWLRSGMPRKGGAAHLMRERYHPEIIARRHLEIYQEVLAQAGRNISQ